MSKANGLPINLNNVEHREFANPQAAEVWFTCCDIWYLLFKQKGILGISHVFREV